MEKLSLHVVIGGAIASSFNSALKSSQNAIVKMGSAIDKVSAKKLKIKKTIYQTNVIKQKFVGNVAKVSAMGVALGGVAFGIKQINDETTQMANLAETVGLSFGTVNTLGAAVKGIGLNYEHVTDIMEELNNKIGESKSVYAEWLKEGKGKGKELKLVGGVDDAFKGLDFSLSDKKFKGLDYEKTFKKFTSMKGDKQFELVMDTALKMKDEQKAASMVDILMGGEANKILSFLRKQGKSYKQFMEDQEKLNFLNKEGLEGAKEYSKVSATTSNILGSIFKQIAGVGGTFMTPVLRDFNTWLKLNKEIVQSNIKGFFLGVKEAFKAIGRAIKTVVQKLEPMFSLFSSGAKEIDKTENSGLTLGKTLVYIAGGFTALLGAKIILGGISMAFMGAKVAVGAFSIASTIATTVFRGLSMVLMANPIGLVIGAVSALVAGVVIAYNKFEWFRDGVNAVWESIKSVFASGSEFATHMFTSPIETIRDMWTGLFNWLSSKFEWMGTAVNKLKSVGSSISGFFGFGEEEEKKIKTPSKKLNYAKVEIPKPQSHRRSARGNFKQTNHIKVVVNNPKSNVDVEKAVHKVLKKQNQKGLSDDI